MAVTPPIIPNLSGSYANIQDALRQGADIASKNYGPMGAAAAAAAPIGQMVSDRAQLAFKAGVEDRLNQNKAYYDAQAQGKTFWTQDDVNNLMQQNYPMVKPPNYPQVGKGFWGTPMDVQDLAAHGKRKAVLEDVKSQFPNDPVKRDAIDLLGMDPRTAPQLALLLGAAKLQKGTDEWNRTYFYNPIDPTQRVYAQNSGFPITDDSQITPKMAAPITKEQQSLKKQVDAYREEMDQNEEAQTILKDPNAKAIEQNAALLRYARSVAGNLRNWKEVSAVAANPDFQDQIERIVNSKTDGSILGANDKKSLQTLLEYDRQFGKRDLSEAANQAVSRATANVNGIVDPSIVRKRIMAAMPDELNGGGQNTVKRMVQGGKKYDVTYGPDGKYISSVEVPQ